MKETRYFFVPDAEHQSELPVEEATHALRVLRLKGGDEMMLMDGEGKFFRAEVTVASTKHCMYEIKEIMPQERAWKGHLHLAIAPTKMNERMEWMAEKATEMGFDELSFLNCKYSERKVIRTDRIDKIVVSAVKQSRKAWKPQVNQMVDFHNFVTQPRNGRKYIAHCYEEIERKNFFDKLKSFELRNNTDTTIMIGPEGDFSIDEVKLAMKHGYEPVSMGSSRLRTETAGLAAVMMMLLSQQNG